MSDQQNQPAGEAGTLGIGAAASDMPASNEPVAATAGAETAKLASGQEETSPKVDAPKVDAVGTEAPKVEASRAEPPKIDAPKIDAVKAEAPRFTGNVTIMSPGDRVGADAKGSAGKRRFGAMAAVVALATVAGALGGALATAGFGKLLVADQPQVSVKDTALETSVARLDTEIIALKASLEHNSKTTTGQINKASDRLDKVEKAQTEPAAKLAKLSEAVDKLRAAQAPTTTVAAASTSAKEKDVTGSIPQQAVAAAAPRPCLPRRPRPRLPGCRRWRAGDCGTSLMAAP